MGPGLGRNCLPYRGTRNVSLFARDNRLWYRRGAPLPLRCEFPLMDVRLSRHRKPEHTFKWDRTDRDLHNRITIS